MKGKSVAILLIVVVLLALIASVRIVSSTKLTFSIAGETVSLEGGQTWYVFDKSNHLAQTISSPTVGVNFALLGSYDSISAKNTGWIRVHEWFRLMDPIPRGMEGLGNLFPWAVIFTRNLSGQLLLDNHLYGDIDFMRWEQPAGFLNLYGNLWPHTSDVVFYSDDIVGTERSAVFYLILDSSKKNELADCSMYPGACIDISSKVAQMADFTIKASVTEYWDDWKLRSTLAVSSSEQCDAYMGHQNTICVQKMTHQEVPISWDAKITDFLYFTTINETPTYVQTKTSTAIETASIYVTVTSNTMIVVEVHTSTTVTATETLPKSGGGNACQIVFGNDFWLCKDMFAGLWNWLGGDFLGIPIWLWILGGVLVVILILRRGPISVNYNSRV